MRGFFVVYLRTALFNQNEENRPMSDDRQLGFNTRQLHAGQEPDPTTGSRAVPIYQTTSYQFRDTEHAANLFALQELGNIYTRIMNPTTDVLEQRMASLEGGVGALAASSGHAAQTHGDPDPVQRRRSHRQQQPACTAAPTTSSTTPSRAWASTSPLSIPADPANFEKAIRPNTKILYGETLGNPDITVFPFEEVAAIAKAHNIPLMIDNTFATPYLCRPVRVGRQHRRPQHHQVPGRPRPGHRRRHRRRRQLRLDAAGRFANFTTPDPSYHGLVYADLLGMGLPPFIIKARVQILRDIGACQAPFNSWNTLQGIETLSLRMDRHVRNAQAVAEFLEGHKSVKWVTLPRPARATRTTSGPRSICPRARARSWASASRAASRPGRSSSTICKLFSHLANVGDAKSLAIHPASTTHSQLTDEEMVTAGVTPDFIRLSVGLEDIEDILWDLDQALAAATK